MNKEMFEIQGLGGAAVLEGEVRISGAKNAALPALASTILFSTPVTLTGMPFIEDIHRTREMIQALGGQADSVAEGTLCVSIPDTTHPDLTGEIAKRMRASVIFTGPLLARFKEVRFPHPGGCVIGPRPIDMFLEAYERMGAHTKVEDGSYCINAPEGLHGAEIFFRQQSVTGTEALMMAAVLAKGTTIIRNAAMEPEIISVAEFLRANGARIDGAGSSIIRVEGGALLTASTEYHSIPDRIEAGSFLILAALAGKKMKISNIVPEHIHALSYELLRAGVPLSFGKDYAEVSARPGTYTPVNIKTHEYPGFPTDLQAPMLVFLTQTSGEGFVFETVFENRLNYTEELVRMGADISIFNPHQALVRGPRPLRARELESPDIRAGLAFVIAASIAHGTSLVHNVYYIDRGYEHIEARLSALGLSITRKTQ